MMSILNSAVQSLSCCFLVAVCLEMSKIKQSLVICFIEMNKFKPIIDIGLVYLYKERLFCQMHQSIVESHTH